MKTVEEAHKGWSAPVDLTRKTLLVIPTYNEAGNIERLLSQIRAEEFGFDLLVIDDNSPDGTGALVEALAERLPVRVMHRPSKLGIGSAHKAGFRYAMDHGYGHVMTMDADFAHSPSNLASMLSCADHADVVVGSRYLSGGGLTGWPLWRRIITHTAHWLTTHLLGLPYDCTGGFRLYDTAVFEQVNFEAIQSDGYAFLTELLFTIVQNGFTVYELPIVINFREHGASKISPIEILRAIKTLMRLSYQRVRLKGRVAPHESRRDLVCDPRNR